MGLETPVVHTLNYELRLYLETTIARLKLKEIDGNLYQRWNMWLNLIVRQEPYQRCRLRAASSAWLSIVRVARCVVCKTDKTRRTEQVKSVWTGCAGLHTCYRGSDKERRLRKQPVH